MAEQDDVRIRLFDLLEDVTGDAVVRDHENDDLFGFAGFYGSN